MSVNAFIYKTTCFEFDLHKNENDIIVNTIFFIKSDLSV